MKCSICGNEYPSVIKECPFCSVENARANAHSDMAFLSDSSSVHDRKPPKHGMHWFFALVLCLLSLSLVLMIIGFHIENYSTDSWKTAFIVYLLIILLPSTSFCSTWFCLTERRYGRSSVWKFFTLICIVAFSLFASLSPSLASSYCDTSANDKLISLLVFISSFVLLSVPHILLKKRSQKKNEAEPSSDTARVKHTGKRLVPIGLLAVGIAIGLFIGLSIDTIDRRSSLQYPIKDKYSRVDMVYVNTRRGNVFHSDSFCRLEEYLLGIDHDSFTEMSEYEAMLRGFERCPECYKYATSSDVRGIEYSIQDIEDALDDY